VTSLLASRCEEERTTATAEADPYGMTNKRTNNSNGKSKDNGNGNGKSKRWRIECIHSHSSRYDCDEWGTRFFVDDRREQRQRQK
jgi:hypothetical protein